MVLACCLWSDSAWEAPWVLASLMAIEQAALASWDGAGVGGLGFFDSLDASDLCFLDSC